MGTQDEQSRQRSRQRDQQNDNRPQQRDEKSDSADRQQQSGRSAAGGAQQRQQNVYGEGNYAASKQYNDATRDFAQSGRVEQAARDAAPRSDADARQMQAAEAEGKRHAKGEDPALNRKSSGLPPGTSNAPKPGEEA
jgi:hypothetical protein